METLQQNRLEKFQRVMTEATEEIAIILSHLDPDSIACAKIFADICKHFEKKSRIYYAGGLHLPQNKIVWNKFGLAEDFIKLEKFTPEKHNKVSVVLLDSSSIKDPRLQNLELRPIIIVDHHLNTDNLQETEAEWYQLSVCGAAITLIVQIYLSLGLDFSANDDLATLAVLGILTDTGMMKLVSKYATDLDREAFTYLMRFADDARIREIFSSVKDKKYLAFLNKATTNTETREDTLITNIGFIDADDEVYAALLAEELCSIQGISTVVVWALDNKNRLYIKIRSVDDKIEMEQFITKRFGEGTGGGRTGAGAAIIEPPPQFYIPSTAASKELYMKFVRQLIVDVLFKNTSE
ncbi:hypothetical protein L6259_02985 [Candidatus Parcubacteria bacterium]|nr:hypothetical protein [Patescibacteria group bacterium]MCG2694205.1 hypothetical protein [Candidatus Parcubacteria bacterium]